MRYQVHFGFELPFRLALPEGEYTVVASGGKPETLSLTNNAEGFDVGDEYLHPEGGRTVVWRPKNGGEHARAELTKQHPGMPVTRRPLKTLVTHVREAQSDSDQNLLQLYEEKKPAWLTESLQLVNRLIDAYQLVATDDDLRGQAARVALWDIRFFVASFWDVPPTRQVLAGHVEPLGRDPTPPPMDSKAVKALREFLDNGQDFPLPRMLHAGALSQRVRGNYRAAIIDDVTALEMSVEIEFQRLALRTIPDNIVKALLRPGGFEDLVKKYLPAVGGGRLDFRNIKQARDLRHRIVHKGFRAGFGEAIEVHWVCGNVLDALGTD